MVNPGGNVFIEERGVMKEVLKPVNEEDVFAGIQALANRMGDQFDEDHPILDTRLPNGARVAAMGSPTSPYGLTLTIRKFMQWFSLEELIQMDTVPYVVAREIETAIKQRKNVLIAGGTGSGKTTALAAFASLIDRRERVICIEKPTELKLNLPHVVRWEATKDRDGRKGISVSQLLTAALRHRPDRIIVGEVRDHSAFDMLQAMNTGHSGTLSTVHADSAVDALHRISELALSAQENLRQDFTARQTARAISLVLHLERKAAKRYVTQLIAVRDCSDDGREFHHKVLYEA
jgi:pilus assembly protein CpaF